MTQVIERRRLKKSLKILHLEDNEASQFILERHFQKECKNISIVHKEDCIDYYPAIIARPDVIVVDWTLADGPVNYILDDLKNFHGKVIIFSANNESLIHRWIIEEIGTLPPHFSIYSKIDTYAYTDMIEEVKLYARRIKKDISA